MSSLIDTFFKEINKRISECEKIEKGIALGLVLDASKMLGVDSPDEVKKFGAGWEKVKKELEKDGKFEKVIAMVDNNIGALLHPDKYSGVKVPLYSSFEKDIPFLLNENDLL